MVRRHRPSSGTEKRPRDESVKSKASSWRGKIGGAHRDLVLNQVGWIKDLGFCYKSNRGLTQSDFCFEGLVMAKVGKEESTGETTALQQLSYNHLMLVV